MISPPIHRRTVAHFSRYQGGSPILPQRQHHNAAYRYSFIVCLILGANLVVAEPQAVDQSGTPSLQDLEKQLEAKKSAATAKSNAAKQQLAKQQAAAMQAEAEAKQAAEEERVRAVVSQVRGAWRFAKNGQRIEPENDGYCRTEYVRDIQFQLNQVSGSTTSLKGPFRESERSINSWDPDNRNGGRGFSDVGLRHMARCNAQDGKINWTQTGTIFTTVDAGHTTQILEVVIDACTGARCPSTGRFQWNAELLKNGDFELGNADHWRFLK